MTKYVRIFGEISGHPEKTHYSTREEVRRAGLHAHKQAGISGTAHEGADAIVLNGGYPDDCDYGDVVIYTGHGGQDNGKRQIAHQSLDDSGNAALVKSQLDGLLVRVIRGYEEESEYAPTNGYRYDGLFKVVRHWFKTRDDGFRVCQFRLVKHGSAADVLDSDIPHDSLQVADDDPTKSTGPAGRSTVTLNKVNRSAAVVRNVKKWHANRCQICGQSVDLPSGPSSDVAHIRALGAPHNGPDIEENALCLCPNDHRRFDNGALYILNDLRIVDALSGAVEGNLRIHSAHKVKVEYIQYHRSCWVDQ
ncbi:YDG/SRA domain-containing protein [Nocardiopsis rhodophaea]|uniref:YDG/SRA domain-containing protein n=1 Tax=Nocardiopsis rhodophaea TaxID=280238 RepID=UPI0031DD31BC